MKKLFGLLLLLVTGASFAQINFEQGTFKNNNGEVTNCLIKNVAWKNNPVKFQYKLTENEPEKEATINEVQAFNVGGYVFERYTVEIERSASTIGSLDASGKPDFKSETLFLKVLVAGNISLLVYEDGNIRKYFYKSEAIDRTEQLLYKRYEENMQVKEYNRYKYQLAQLFADAKYPQGTYDRLKYDEKSLKNLFLKYNGITGTATDETKGQNKSKFAFRVTAGVHQASIETQAETLSYREHHDFGNKTVFSGGLEVEWIMPFNNNKWSLFLNPNYQSYKQDDRKTMSSAGRLYGWKAEANYLSVPIGARYYMFLTQKSKIFVNVAYTLNFKTGGQLSNNNMVFDLTSRQGWLVGVGFSYGNAGAELRYHLKRDLFNYVYRTADYNNVGIVLSYKVL
jgi:hypothetical protein